LKLLVVFFAIGLFFVTPASAGDGSELFAVQKNPNVDASSLYGIWAGPDQQSGPFKFTLRFKIENALLTGALRCEVQGSVVFAENTAPIKVSQDTITLLQNMWILADHCNFGMKMGDSAYSIQKGLLTLQNQPIQFEKLQDVP
jgi:hypothetical protein